MDVKEFYEEWKKIDNDELAQQAIIGFAKEYHAERMAEMPSDDTFEQVLKEEFLVNTQNYPKEYHDLFMKKFRRAESKFKSLTKD